MQRRRWRGRAARRRDAPVEFDGVLEAECGQLGITEQEVKLPGKGRAGSQARAIIGWLVRQLPELTLQKAAQRLGWDISSLSAAASKLERRLREDEELEWTATQLRGELQIT